MADKIILFDQQSADGNSSDFKIENQYYWAEFSGTFGGGTAKLQVRSTSGWVDISDSAKTTSAQHLVGPLQAGARIRGDLSGATSPSLSLVLNPLPEAGKQIR